MSIQGYIYLVGLVIWLFPAARQRMGRFFYFFYLLAIAEPLALLMWEFFKIYPSYIFILVSILQIIVLQKLKLLELPKTLVSITIFLGILLLYVFPEKSNYSMIFLEFIIALQLIRLLFIEFFREETINFFLSALVFYEITIFLNMTLIFLPDAIKGLKLHEITYVFQYILALFFTIFREDSRFMKIKLKTVEEKLGDEFNSPNV